MATKIPNSNEIYQNGNKVPNDPEIYQIFMPSPSKIYQNWPFWFENKPSGNPGVLNSKAWSIKCLLCIEKNAIKFAKKDRKGIFLTSTSQRALLEVAEAAADLAVNL
jgi:hypothetical protein